MLAQVSGSQEGAWCSFVFLQHVLHAPVVVAFNFGKHAERLAATNDAEYVSLAMNVIRSAYGHHVPDPVAHLISRHGHFPSKYGGTLVCVYQQNKLHW